MITGIDHLILAIDRGALPAIEDDLFRVGFEHGDAGVHEAGTANHNIAFAGGAFVELLYQHLPGGGRPMWFGRVPRLQGIGFTSNDYDTDIARFLHKPDAWDEDFPKVLTSGERVSVHAAGPTKRDEFYPFVMKREKPPFDKTGARATLTSIVFSGRDTEVEYWRDGFRRWFALPESEGSLHVGDDIEISFRPEASESMNIFAHFSSPVGADAAIGHALTVVPAT
jgi:hypothetical protein